MVYRMPKAATSVLVTSAGVFIGRQLAVTIADGLAPEDKLELRYRGRLSAHAAKEQLGWTPRYQLRAGIAEYGGAYRQYLDTCVLTWSRAVPTGSETGA